jgi:hypothetical protein
MSAVMNSEWLVYSALVTSFNALNLGPTAYPEREFDPPTDDSIWYEVFNIPAARDPDTLGDEGEDMFVGVFQVDVNGPVGDGIRRLTEAACVVTANYTAGKKYIKDEQEVLIRKADMTQARRSETNSATLTISVSVYYYSMIKR